MHSSIDRLISFTPEAIYLTHYSRVRDVAELGADLHRRLDAMVAIARGVTGSGAPRHEALKAEPVSYTHLDVYKRQRATITLLQNLGTAQPCATVGIQFIEPPDT